MSFLYNREGDYDSPGGFYLWEGDIELSKIDANGQEVQPEDFGGNPNDPDEPFTFEFEADGVAYAMEDSIYSDEDPTWMIEFYNFYEGNTSPKEITFGEKSEPEPEPSGDNIFVGDTPISNVYVGQIPVSKMFVGETQVYPAEAPIGDASPYTIIHRKEGITSGAWLPKTLDGAPYKVSREVDADGNRIWMDGVPGSSYSLRTDTILIDAPKGSGLTFFTNTSARYDWVEDVECFGHDELGDFAYLGYVNYGVERNWWSCFDRPITLTNKEAPSMERMFQAGSSNQGTIGDLSTFTKNLTGQKWGEANGAFSKNDITQEQDFGRWIGGWDKGYIYSITEREGEWGDFSACAPNYLTSTYWCPRVPDMKKCAFWINKTGFDRTGEFVEMGSYTQTTATSNLPAGVFQASYNTNGRKWYLRMSLTNLEGDAYDFSDFAVGDVISYRGPGGKGGFFYVDALPTHYTNYDVPYIYLYQAGSGWKTNGGTYPDICEFRHYKVSA